MQMAADITVSTSFSLVAHGAGPGFLADMEVAAQTTLCPPLSSRSVLYVGLRNFASRAMYSDADAARSHTKQSATTAGWSMHFNTASA